MYTDKEIEKLIQPILVNERKREGIILSKLADRLKQIGTLSPSDIQTLINIRNLSQKDTREINRELAKLSKLSEKEIKSIIKEVAGSDYAEAKSFYDYRGKTFVPYAENIDLQRRIKAIENLTLQDFMNISNTTAFMVRDLTNPLIIRPTKLSKAYANILDYAITSITSGLGSYNTIIPEVIQTMVDKGITTVEFESETGRKTHRRVDSAVKNTILNGIRQVQQEVQDLVGEEIGSDGVEISVHENSAPDHEPIQGHQLTNEEYEKLQTQEDFEDTNNIAFSAIERPIGMWNCRHFVMRIILGHKTPNYSLDELEEIKKRNANGITYKNKNGDTVTKSKYWCTQKRNNYELEIRKLKEMQKIAEKAFNDKVVQEYEIKIRDMIDKYTSFCNLSGLKPRYTNLRVYV